MTTYNFDDLTGKKFGRLLVNQRYIDKIKDFKYKTKWFCVCDCGNKIIVNSSNLKNGNTKSCGCLQKERTSAARKIHGMSNKRFYNIWSNIKLRCTNKNHSLYGRYGGRGITVCKEWRNFNNFYNDMYESYLKHCNDFGEKETTIDRINNDLNYTKNNCKWSNKLEQENNKSTSRYVEYNDNIYTLSNLCRKYNVPYKLIHKRLTLGWTIDDAINVPMGMRRMKKCLN